MAARIVKTWRGRVRAQLRATKKRLNSLLSYNTRHPEVGFLTVGDVVSINTVTAILDVKLAATKAR